MSGSHGLTPQQFSPNALLRDNAKVLDVRLLKQVLSDLGVVVVDGDTIKLNGATWRPSGN